MKKLPLGVYVVSPDVTEETPRFTFRETEYTATPGINAFPDLETLIHAELLSPEEPFLGYGTNPVVLIPAGILPCGVTGKTKEERFRIHFPKAVSLLGENVGISPNGEDLRCAAERREESVLQGSLYYGALALGGTIPGEMVLDGLTLHTRFLDLRTGGEQVGLTVKNCILTANISRNLIEIPASFEGTRSTQVLDCRTDGIEAMGGDGCILSVSAGDLTVERLYVAHTEKFLGCTDYTMRAVNRIQRLSMKDCLFCDANSYHGLTLNLPSEAEADLALENVRFLRFTPREDSAVTVVLPEKSRLALTDCRFEGKESPVPAVQIRGSLENVTCHGCVSEGFSRLLASVPERRTVPDPQAVYPLEDPHEALKGEDFQPLDLLYANRRPLHGDFHCHSNSGGTSDGKTPLAEYVPKMKELGLDFVAIVDHKQMRHYFLPEWDEKYMICGSEPAVLLNEPDRPKPARGLDYTMIFPDKTGLAQVMGAFPRFQFTGTRDGHFKYASFTLQEMQELAEYIYNIGGLLSHAHPKQKMVSSNPLDYYISDLVALETVHVDCDAFSTKQNRNLWIGILKAGKRVRTHGSSDAHGAVSNRGQTTVYCENHFSTDIFNTIRAGDCTAGAIGIQMCLDSCPMGSVTDYAEGKKLYVRVNDFHPAHQKENTVYSLKIFTEKGLAYAKEFDGTYTDLVLPVLPRAYYRAEITNESDGVIVALSNPIWQNLAEA